MGHGPQISLAGSLYRETDRNGPRDCLDHMIVLGEWHLYRVLREYVGYYNESRTHLSPEKECRVPRSVEPPDLGPIRKSPVLRGLHHRYFREVA